MAEGQPLYIDTFHGGNIMSADGCADFLKELTEGELDFQYSFLTAVSKKEIIGRMLRNLKRIYLETSAFPKLVQILDKLVLLYPQSPEEIRDRGIVFYQMKAFKSALQDFQNFLSMAPESEDAGMIHQYVEILREYDSRLN
jgi:regulator of sirC expression with transglutaminase-like and TPR domain